MRRDGNAPEKRGVSKGAVSVNIVVWKAPKSLHGLLRRLFGMKKPKEA